jgi:hypothetical protein
MKKNRTDWHIYFEGENRIGNRSGLTETGIELLVRDFDPIEAIAPGYGKRILRYVLDGEGDDILPELEMVDLYFKARHFAPNLRDRTTREVLFREGTTGGHDFLDRLGRVYHALMNPLNPNFLMPTRFQSPSWLEALLLHASGSYSGDIRTYLQLKIVEDLIIASAESRDELVRAVIFRVSFDYSACEIVSIFFSLIDFPTIAAEHPGPVREALENESEAVVLQALTIIDAFGIDPRPFAETIARHAVGGDRVRRHAAQRIARSRPDVFVPEFAGKLGEADTESRLRAVRLVGDLGEAGNALLEKLLDTEKSEPIRNAIRSTIDSAGGPADDDSRGDEHRGDGGNGFEELDIEDFGVDGNSGGGENDDA